MGVTGRSDRGKGHEARPTRIGGLKGQFHEPTNHADERQRPKKIDWRDRFNWSANQCCLVFPLNCSC